MHRVFERYEGKKSYTELGLEPPMPMEQDIEHADEWSHMSDYDEMGISPSNDTTVENGEPTISLPTIDNKT